MKTANLVTVVGGMILLSAAFRWLHVDRNWMFALIALALFVIFAVYRRYKDRRRSTDVDIILAVPGIVAIVGLLARDFHFIPVSTNLVWILFAGSAIICVGYFYMNTAD